jgi:nuclear GTP-binding protein
LLDDPIKPVAFILDKVPKEQLVNVYEIGSFSDVDDFLGQLAFKRGRILKGGEPDIEAMARIVLTDWNKGRIRYFTLPPPADETIPAGAMLISASGEVYEMERTIDFAEQDLRNFQVRHVFELVQKKRGQVEQSDEDDGNETERIATGDELPPEEREELDGLAQEYMTIQFDGL